MAVPDLGTGASARGCGSHTAESAGSWLARVAHEVATPPVALVAVAILVLVHLRAVGRARELLAAVGALDHVLETRRGPTGRPATHPRANTGQARGGSAPRRPREV